jgi:hypothetical protein
MNWVVSKTSASVAAKGGSILGQSFGRLGTVVENPNIGVKMLDEGGHYLAGKINRMVPSADVIGILKNPSVVLQQANSRFLYLSQKAGVVINQNGKLITTYRSGNFDANILNVLKAAGH